MRGYHATEPYAKAMRKRQVWVEPLFAEAKDWHGLRRFRLRGLEKVNGEALLIAAGQNLKRLLSRRGWGRRPFPSGAAGVVLPARQPLTSGGKLTWVLVPAIPPRLSGATQRGLFFTTLSRFLDRTRSRPRVPRSFPPRRSLRCPALDVSARTSMMPTPQTATHTVRRRC